MPLRSKRTTGFAGASAGAAGVAFAIQLAALGQVFAEPAPAAGEPQVPQPAPAQNAASPAPDSPNVLDGLESLQIAQDADFAAPIIDAQELFQGRPFGGGAPQASSSRIAPLEADLSTPDLKAPTSLPVLEAGPLNSPNENLPSLQIPDAFGPTMSGLPLDTLAPPGPSMRQRPLGALGVPSFWNARKSFVLGGSRVRYGVAIDAGVAYNNNVFAAPSNPQGDQIFSLQPTLYLETGKKGSVRFLWSPSFLRYAKYKQFDSVNQSFLFSSRYRWTKLRVGLDASYLAQSGLFLNSNGQAQQKAVYARMFAGYALTKKTEMLFNFDGTLTDSSPGGRQFQGTFTASVDYRYSRKTTIGAAVALGYFTSTTGTTTSESFLLRLLYSPTSKLVFRGEGGLQFRQSSSTGGSSSAVTSVVNAALTYTPSSKTYVSLRFFRSVDMDAFNAGNLQITTSLESAGSWKITPNLALDGAIGVGRVENVAMNGVDLGTYNFVQANLALSYLLTSDVNVRLFNNLQQRLNDTQGSNYMSNTSGMSLGMRF